MNQLMGLAVRANLLNILYILHQIIVYRTADLSLFHGFLGFTICCKTRSLMRGCLYFFIHVFPHGTYQHCLPFYVQLYMSNQICLALYLFFPSFKICDSSCLCHFMSMPFCQVVLLFGRGRKEDRKREQVSKNTQPGFKSEKLKTELFCFLVVQYF